MRPRKREAATRQLAAEVKILPAGISSKSKRILWFCARFFVIFFFLEFIVNAAPLDALTSFIAGTTGMLIGAPSFGRLVFAGNTVFEVTNACTGLMSASILAAVVFSMRKPEIKKKLLLFAAGVVALLVINIPRVAVVVYSSTIGFDSDFVHSTTWFIMSAAVLLIWYYGTIRLTKSKNLLEML